MNLTKKDSILLIILGSLMYGLVLYYLIYTPISNYNVKLKSNIDELQVKYDFFKDKYDNKAKLEAEIINNKAKIDEYDNNLPPILSQDDLIVNIDVIEKNTGVSFQNVSFGQVDIMPEIDDLELFTEGEDIIEPYLNLEQGIKTTVNVNISISNNGFEELLSYIYSFDNRVVIDNFNISNNSETDLLVGSMTLSFYGLSSPDRMIVREEIKDIPLGKDNVFVSNNSKKIEEDEEEDEEEDDEDDEIEEDGESQEDE